MLVWFLIAYAFFAALFLSICFLHDYHVSRDPLSRLLHEQTIGLVRSLIAAALWPGTLLLMFWPSPKRV